LDLKKGGGGTSVDRVKIPPSRKSLPGKKKRMESATAVISHGPRPGKRRGKNVRRIKNACILVLDPHCYQAGTGGGGGPDYTWGRDLVRKGQHQDGKDKKYRDEKRSAKLKVGEALKQRSNALRGKRNTI